MKEISEVKDGALLLQRMIVLNLSDLKNLIVELRIVKYSV